MNELQFQDPAALKDADPERTDAPLVPATEPESERHLNLGSATINIQHVETLVIQHGPQDRDTGGTPPSPAHSAAPPHFQTEPKTWGRQLRPRATFSRTIPMDISPTILRMHPELDPEQRRVIAHGPGPMLVMAGPGSGKTLCVELWALNLLLTGQGPVLTT